MYILLCSRNAERGRRISKCIRRAIRHCVIATIHYFTNEIRSRTVRVANNGRACVRRIVHRCAFLCVAHYCTCNERVCCKFWQLVYVNLNLTSYPKPVARTRVFSDMSTLVRFCLRRRASDDERTAFNNARAYRVERRKVLSSMRHSTCFHAPVDFCAISVTICYYFYG